MVPGPFTLQLGEDGPVTALDQLEMTTRSSNPVYWDKAALRV